MDQQLECYLQNLFMAEQATATIYDDTALSEYLKLGPLRAFIPTQLGGAMTGSASYLTVVERTSFYSVPLGLTLGITGSLFLQPICRHAQPSLREKLLPRFLTEPCLGGIMVTEPTGGTDIMGMSTCHSQSGGGYLITGEKCWAGLTGKAEHWLVATRKVRNGKPTKMLALAYMNRAATGFEVTETFSALGLQPIPYGRTSLTEVKVAADDFLTPPEGSGLRQIYDTVFRSRMGISAIASGLCWRLSEDAQKRCQTRTTFGKALSGYDQVQKRLHQIRGLHAVNRALWNFAADWMDSHRDLSAHYSLVNSTKVVSSESMTSAADSAIQLWASAAYTSTHYAGRAYVDSRPFRIFEGPNDVLNENTTDMIIRTHGGISWSCVLDELSVYGLLPADDIPAHVKRTLDQTILESQRNKTTVGWIISNIVASAILSCSSAISDNEREFGMHVLLRQLASACAELEADSL